MSFKQGVCALGVFAVVLAGPANAATTQVSALLDTDNNHLTGCSVNTGSGTFDGVEQVLTTIFDADAKVVTSVTRQQCGGGTLGSPQIVDAGGWSVGVTGGIYRVETHIPFTLLGATTPIRLGFTATSGTLSAVVLQRPDGSIILYPGLLPAGRHRVANPNERNIVLDGQVGDWSGMPSLAPGAASNGTSSLRFIDIYAAQNSTDLFFRFDVQSNPSAPTANDDSYSVIRGGTLNVAAPGVLGNDQDPNLLPLTALLLSGAQHGTLNLGANGGFTYVNDGSPAVVDSFRYKANNGSADSNPAQVTIAIITGTAPVITSANSATFTVGTTSSFTVTATGNPPPSISESGPLPNGLTFNSSTHAISGNPAVGTGGIYNLTFIASNAAGTATQSFTLTVNEAPSIKTAATNQTVCVGATASFVATANGFPQPAVQWQISTNGGATFTNIAGATATTYAFTAAAADNGNQYRAVFSSGLGTVNTTATLTVNTAAAVSTQPANQTVCAGASASFTAAATGTPAPVVQWQVSADGGATFTDIAGATSATYAFTTSAADSGKQFRAVFTNACATANTNAATLTVNTAAAVTTNPASQTVCDSTTATFTAAASGSPAPTVQWQVSLDNGVTFNAIPGATSPTLSFTAMTADNTKQYRAVFTNSCATVNSAAATLTVTTVPVVTTNPATQTICAGGPVTFTAATSSPATTVQWQRSIDGGATFTAITGATSTTLTFTTATSDNGYQYRAVFTDICGSMNTTAATLTVNVAAAVTTQPVNQTVCDTQTATFTAAGSGTPAPTVQWQVSTNGGATFANVPGATSTTLSFAATAAENGDQYRAVFTNSCGAVNTNAATLMVNTPPVVTTNPATQTVCAGNLASFTVAATGQPTPSVQWQLSIDGGVTFGNISGATSTTYSFTAQPADSGHQYRAALTNTCGTANSTAATLTVNIASAVTVPPTNQTVCAGATATFTAAASGTPTPAVQWQVSTNGGTTFTDIVGATSTTLSFTTAAADNANLYHAVFTNACGVATTADATLTVNTAPVVTTPPASQAVCNNATATFTAAASGQPAPTVQWQVSTDGGLTFTDITGQISTTYSFTVTLADNTKQYRAVFTNTCSTATTTAVTLTVDQTIAINTQPTDQSVNAGNPVTFTASASNFTSVQWMVSTDGGTTFSNVAGATTETLTFTTQLTDNGKKYKAVYANSCGTAATNVVTLTVSCATITVTRTGGGSFPNGTFNVVYTDGVTASGGTASHTFAITSGALPGGLSINSSTGAIIGTPNATGTFNFTVTATDVGDSCTGAQSFSIAINPVIGPDSYSNLVDNTQAAVTGGLTASPATPFVPLTGSLIANDFPGGGVAAVAGTFSSANGTNNVVIASDGTFIYTPPVTASPLASDSFTYTIMSDTGGTGTPAAASGTVNLTLSGRVWYVNNSGANGNGQSQSPFNSLSSFSSTPRVSPDTTGDIIFVYNGNSATTPYDGGVKLLDNEQLIGEGVVFVVSGNTLVSAGTKPQITNTAVGSDVIVLANGNTVKGLTINGAPTVNGIHGNGVAGFIGDTLTIQNTAIGLDINPMTGTVTVTNTSITNNALGVVINGGSPNVTMNSTNSISGGGSESVLVQNLLAAGVVNIGASITDTGGGIIIGGNASGSSISFTGTQTLNGTTGVSMTSDSGATITFSGTLNIGNTTPVTVTGFGAIGGGTLNVSGTANITGGTATGLSLNGMTIGGSGVTFNSVGGTGMTTGISIVNTTATNTNPVVINGGTMTNPTTGITMQGANTNLSLNGVTVTGATTALTNTTNFGTLDIGANVNLSGATAINLTTGTIVGTFNHVSSTGGTNGVSFTAITTSNAWGCTCSGDTLTGASGATFKATNLNAGGIMTWGGNINQANGADAVNISGSTAFITFSGHVTTSGTSTGINISSSTGSYSFNDSTPNGSTIAGSGGGITIGSGTTANVTFGSGYAITTIATPFLVSGTPSAVTGNITYSGTINKTTAGRLVDVTSLNSPGSLNMSRTTPAVGDLTLNNSGATGISVVNSSGNITIANASITFVSAGAAFTGSGNSGSINLAGLQATGTGSSPGLLISGGGTINITGSAANPAINVSGGSGRAIDGTTSSYTGALNLTNATISGNAALDSITLTGTALGGTASTVTGSNRGLVMSGGSLANGGGMTSVSSSGGTNGISLTNVTGGTYTIGGGSLSNNTGSTFLVSGGSATFTYNGTMSQSSPQRVVNISGITGGTITLGGAITGSTSCSGITLGGSGGTVTISGAISLNGPSDTFSSSTSGLTINASNVNNVIGNTSAPTGPALSISNATIGSGNLVFKSISANFGTNGILLSNTGASGGLHILGGGSTTQGGDSSGGTIQNSTDRGIQLTNTHSVQFNNIKVDTTGSNAVRTSGAGIGGSGVVDFTLTFSTVSNNGVEPHTSLDSNIDFGTATGGSPTDNNVSGTITITNNKLLSAREHGIEIQNYSGTINDAQINNNLIQSDTTSATSSGSGIQLLGFGSAGGTSNITKATISGNTINYFPAGAGITAQFGNSAGAGGTWGTPHSITNLITISSNTMTGFSAAAPMNTNAVLCTLFGNGQAAWSVTGNTASLVGGSYIGVNVAGTAPIASCDIKNNILNGMTSSSAQTISYAISDVSSPAESPTLTGTISNNTISGQDGTGIFAEATSAVSGNLSVTISGNSITAPNCGGCNRFGLEVTSGFSTTVTGTPTACYKITGNTSAGSGIDTGIAWVKRTGCTFNVDSFPSPGTDPTSFIAGLNPAGGGVTRVASGTTAGACSAP